MQEDDDGASTESVLYTLQFKPLQTHGAAPVCVCVCVCVCVWYGEGLPHLPKTRSWSQLAYRAFSPVFVFTCVHSRACGVADMHVQHTAVSTLAQHEQYLCSADTMAMTIWPMRYLISPG